MDQGLQMLASIDVLKDGDSQSKKCFSSKVSTSHCLVRPVASSTSRCSIEAGRVTNARTLATGDNFHKFFLTVENDSLCTSSKSLCSATKSSSLLVIDALSIRLLRLFPKIGKKYATKPTRFPKGLCFCFSKVDDLCCKCRHPINLLL